MHFKEARKNAGLSMVEVAYRLGVSVTAVNAWEAGLYAPGAKRLPKLAELYHCSVDELLGIDAKQRDSA